jgi:hypothetical protein
MRFARRIVFGVFVASVLVVAGGSTAHAALNGPCTAVGTLRATGKAYDAKVVDNITIPRVGDVDWKASTGKSGRRLAVGEVRVKFPAPIGEVTVGDWGKNGKTTNAAGNSGDYHYDLPTLIAGIKVPVSGDHSEPGVTCSGVVVVQIEGTSPLAWASLAFTVFAIAGLALAIRARPNVVAP